MCSVKKTGILTSDATGTAATAYSGSQTIHSDLFGGSLPVEGLYKGSEWCNNFA
jgi:hypothetical protein